MIIQSIQKKGNNVIITFDNSETITVAYQSAVKKGLRKNDVLSDSDLEELKIDSERLKIKDYIFKLLSRREHSSYELKRKLIQKKFNHQLVENVINEFLEKGYINDTLFAENYYKQNIVKKKIGINKLKADLLKRGIEGKVIDKLIDENRDTDLLINNAVILAQKRINYLIKIYSDKNKIRQKVFSYLQNKGFEYEIIKSALRQLDINIEDD
ncbi:regulatory protein RecX [Melioribacteraceae bacterium 4301-Me]|uniref:regulatory protein RecX n=1 Tax=Pyranulibacter aquaticus TaxID=3163344 RepID=UPI00359701D4